MAEAIRRQNRANRRRAQSFESLVQAGLTVFGEALDIEFKSVIELL